MTVNVSLCGSIPRSEMISFSSGPQQLNESFNSSLNSTKSDELVALAASSLARKVSDDIVVSNSQIVQPPSWAVPARGEVILEVSAKMYSTCLFRSSFNSYIRSFSP